MHDMDHHFDAADNNLPCIAVINGKGDLCGRPRDEHLGKNRRRMPRRRPDPRLVNILAEIAQVTMNRMNSGKAAAEEGFTLGQIMGIATRYPEVLARLQEIEEEANA